MARCRFCGAERAEVYLDYARLSLCGECFKKFYERKVGETVERYRMLPRRGGVAVAVSGGKDSGSLLYVLRRLYPDLKLTAVYLNLGIEGYSDRCEDVVRRLAELTGVQLKVFDLEGEEGFTVGDLASTRFRRKVCSACGVVKRYWMNRITYEMGLNVVATGHNLDDMVEFALNHYVHGDVEALVRLKPVLPSVMGGKLVAKVKPLCHVTGFEDLMYAEYTGIPYRSVDCPFASGRGYERRKAMVKNILEVMPNFRHVFFKSHLKRLLPVLEEGWRRGFKLGECRVCGMPSTGDVCSYCRLKKVLGVSPS